MEPTDIMLTEYKMLREEIQNSMQVRNSILSFGLASIAGVVTASMLLYSISSALCGVALAFVIPVISIVILFMWLGEYQRVQRAGRFLVDLEKRINLEAGRELLTWESALRAQRRHMRYPYYSVALMLTTMSVLSSVVGLVLLGLPQWAMWVLILGTIVIHVALYSYASASIAKLRL